MFLISLQEQSAMFQSQGYCTEVYTNFLETLSAQQGYKVCVWSVV